MRSRRSRAAEFGPKVRKRIKERDRACVFCQWGYHMESTTAMGYMGMQIMHIIPRSQGGMGVEQNGVIGCIYHHQLLDNGNKGLREDMKGRLEEYMKRMYPGWTREEVTYRKWG